jgi:hypothetical protein
VKCLLLKSRGQKYKLKPQGDATPHPSTIIIRHYPALHSTKELSPTCCWKGIKWYMPCGTHQAVPRKNSHTPTTPAPEKREPMSTQTYDLVHSSSKHPSTREWYIHTAERDSFINQNGRLTCKETNKAQHHYTVLSH